MPNTKIRVNGIQPKKYCFEMHVQWVVVEPAPGIMIPEILLYLQKSFCWIGIRKRKIGLAWFNSYIIRFHLNIDV